jgi:microcystin-dependent protein
VQQVPTSYGIGGLPEWVRKAATALNQLIGQVADDRPAGTPQFWTLSAIPKGWIEADGTVYEARQYPRLYEACRVDWGLPDNRFRVPDYRGRVPIGRGAGLAVGQIGGAAQISLSVAQLPAHSHPVTDPGHAHVFIGAPHSHPITDPGHRHDAATGDFALAQPRVGAADALYIAPGRRAKALSLDDVVNAAPRTATSETGVAVGETTAGGAVMQAETGITIANTGQGEPVSILPPYFVGTWIIKT